MNHFQRLFALLALPFLAILSPSPLQAEGHAQAALAKEDLDEAAFAESVGGVESRASLPKNGPKHVIWTRNSRTDGNGMVMGDSNLPGTRHVRVGFKKAIAVGSVLVRGGGRLSVLKPDAAYPGGLTREEDWLPAERLQGAAITREAVDSEHFAVWSLPPGTQTRALRFTHTPQITDAKYSSRLGGALILSERFINIAPLALAAASARNEAATKIHNETDEGWGPWDNGTEGAEQVISPEHPEWVMLVWPRAVSLKALETISTGFSGADLQIYTGKAEQHPREASESDWKTLKSFSKLENGYPTALWPNAMELDESVSTRAIRLKITAPSLGGHPHIAGKLKDGRRVWLGELIALHGIGTEPLKPLSFPVADDAPHPPIAVPFTLEKPGYVTLVIEDDSGKRVRNLVSETPFPAGKNVAWWDGTDDLGRDPDAVRHGVYRIPAQFVSPGKYRVRGLVRDEIEPHYEFSIYSAGHPAWETADKSGGWLTNHTPPQAALFVPAQRSPTGSAMVYLGSAVSEGGAGLAWVDLNGKKIGGRGWIGGNWTAAPFLARDAGSKAEAQSFAYVGATWTASASNTDKSHGELRITALTKNEDKTIAKIPFTPPASEAGDHHWIDQLGGIAVHNQLVVASMNKLDRLFLIDAAAGKLLVEWKVASPRGLAFDAEGHLLVLAGTKLLRFTVDDRPSGQPAPPQTLIANGLKDPHGLTLDGKGRIYVGDYGDSHQVKVFSPQGQLLRSIGTAGAPKAGTYDPLHMNHPTGLAVDGNERLWVAENDYLPKRVSVWNADGSLWKAFYGPAKYGGGGTLDSRDKSLFFYADEGRGAMEFKLDWSKGESQLSRVYYRREARGLKLPDRSAAPESALYRESNRYFTNCYNSNPTGGSTAFLFIERDGVARPVAALGRAAAWEVLKGDAFASRMPAGADWKQKPPLFLWSDANDDGEVQPEEVTLQALPIGGVTVMPDLSLCAARVGDKAMRFEPIGFTKGGTPLYDLAKGQTLAEGVQNPASSGGDQMLAGKGGWSVITLGIAPYSKLSLSGACNGVPNWSYPNLWPGLHAAHEAPAPDRPGEIIGPTRLLGGFVTPKGSDAGQIWGINANMGTLYLFTADGLFIATVFNDKRQGKPWAMPAPEREMSLKGFSLGEENFWPTWSQTPDGKVYVMNGTAASLVRLDGLESIRRLPAASLSVNASDLRQSEAYVVALEARRQQTQGRGVLEVALREQAPSVDGKVDDWAGAAWVDIDKSGVAANFNSKSKPYDVTAALAIAGDRLYAAFRTGDEKLLQNSGEVPNAPFKTGGCLDLMLAVNPAADPKRSNAAEGDLRLLVTLVKGKPKALLYRAVVPGVKDPVPFSSPWRTITLDRVDDVSADVQLAGAGGNYELSIPLATLGLKPTAGQSLKGDIGILRGNGAATTARVYWSNKATGITSDVPSEAALTPLLWGRLEIKSAK